MMFYFFVPLQILLESLPISSSSHLALLGYQPTTALDFFAHGPTVLVLLIYFRNDIYTLLAQWSYQWHRVMPYFIKLLCAEVPAIFMKFFIFKTSKIVIPLWGGLAITGLMLLSLRLCRPVRRGSDLSWKAVLAIGIMQGFALLPGISRLASTLVVARWCGVDQRTAFRFTCALQIPLFAGASMIGLWLLIAGDPANAYVWSFSSIMLICLAMIGAYFLLKMIERLYCTDRLWPVGFYMAVPLLFSLFL